MRCSRHTATTTSASGISTTTHPRRRRRTRSSSRACVRPPSRTGPRMPSASGATRARPEPRRFRCALPMIRTRASPSRDTPNTTTPRDASAPTGPRSWSIPRATGRSGYLDEVLDAQADRVARITELIRAARVGRAERLRRQAEGETLDLDAAIDAVAALRMGDLPDPRVYQTMARRHRDLAVSVLLDTSQSTGRPRAGHGAPGARHRARGLHPSRPRDAEPRRPLRRRGLRLGRARGRPIHPHQGFRPTLRTGCRRGARGAGTRLLDAHGGGAAPRRGGARPASPATAVSSFW